MADQDLTDLVQKMEFGVETSVWEEDNKTTNTNNPDLPAPRRNAPRNLRKIMGKCLMKCHQS